MTAFRLCVDLNIWIKQYLGNMAGRRGTVPQRIVQAVEDGRSGIGPIQLIVSHTMLTRLQGALMRQGASADIAMRFAQDISNIALMGPAGEFPRMVLGGGVEPTQESRSRGYNPYAAEAVAPPYDPEDGRVLDTALSGTADALVTSNFRDFKHHNDDAVVRDRVHVRKSAHGDLWIVQPEEMMDWLATGRKPRPLPEIMMRRRKDGYASLSDTPEIEPKPKP